MPLFTKLQNKMIYLHCAKIKRAAAACNTCSVVVLMDVVEIDVVETDVVEIDGVEISGILGFRNSKKQITSDAFTRPRNKYGAIIKPV